MIMLVAAALSGFTLVARTDRADYYRLDGKLSVDVRACEQFVHVTERTLGITLPHFEYYRVATADDVFRYSEEGHYAGGFADAEHRLALSTKACSKHEMVHLMTYEIGRAPRLFEEGLASFLADEFTPHQRFGAKRRAQWKKLRYASVNRGFVAYVGSTDSIRTHYLISEEFVRHLIGTYGLERLVTYFRAASDESFRALYGATPAETFERWLYGTKAAP